MQTASAMSARNGVRVLTEFYVFVSNTCLSLVPNRPVDFGWGCGCVVHTSYILVGIKFSQIRRYRNFLMSCTSLISQQRQPMYFPLLDVSNGSVTSSGHGELTGPGVRGLQAWIENAWHSGEATNPLLHVLAICLMKIYRLRS